MKKDFDIWLRDLITDAKVASMHKQKEQNAKKQGGGFYNAGVQICRLSKHYDNNAQVKRIMKEGKEAEKLRTERVRTTHSDFVFDFIFNK